MSYSILGSTKILTLTTAPFLFISVSALSVFEFAMVPGVYILLCPQQEEVHFSSWVHRFIYIHFQQHNHWKDLNPCLSLYYYDKGIVELAIWAIFSVGDSQQIAFVILNRFCPLSKLPPTPTPLFLKNKTKLDGIPSKIKWKMHVFWYILFRVLSFGTSHKKI